MSQLGLFVVVPAVTGFFASTRRAAVLAATTLLVVKCLIYYLPSRHLRSALTLPAPGPERKQRGRVVC